MARGTQFLALRTRLRAELKRSSSVAVGVEDVDTLNETINHVYNVLYMQRDWPHLRKVFSVTLAAGQYHYNFPTGLNSERVLEAWTLSGSVRTPVERGITQEDYAGIDSGADERSDPVLKWDVRWTGSSDQIEVWPIPVSTGGYLKLDGVQAISRLTADADLCLLDDTLVVLFAAAELLKGEDREGKLSAARDYLQSITARASGRGNGYRLGLGEFDDDRRPKITLRVN